MKNNAFVITLLIVATYLVSVAEVKASTYHNRRLIKNINRVIIPHQSVSSRLYDQLRYAAASGKSRKLSEAIRLADKHGVEFKHRKVYFGLNQLGNLLRDAATGGNVKSLALMLEYADRHNFPRFPVDAKFDSASYSTSLSDMLTGAAQYGHIKVIDAVVQLATERGLHFTADDFTRAMQFAAYNAKTKAIKHIAAVAKQGLDPKRFSDEVLAGAAQSGNAQTIELVAAIAAEQGILLASKHWGRALQIAAWEGYRATRKVLALIDASDVQIKQDDFVNAAAMAVGNYSALRSQWIIIFATNRQHVKFSADDLGLMMVIAARVGSSAQGIHGVIKIADKYSITLSRKHFVAAMQQAVQIGNYEALEHAVKAAAEYGTLLTGDDLATTVIEGMNSSLRYSKTFFVIDDLAARYDIKIAKKHFSRLLAEAVARSQLNTQLKADRAAAKVIDFAISNDIAIDAEYFATAISYTDDVKVISKLNALASARDIKF